MNNRIIIAAVAAAAAMNCHTTHNGAWVPRWLLIAEGSCELFFFFFFFVLMMMMMTHTASIEIPFYTHTHTHKETGRSLLHYFYYCEWVSEWVCVCVFTWMDGWSIGMRRLDLGRAKSRPITVRWRRRRRRRRRGRVVVVAIFEGIRMAHSSTIRPSIQPSAKWLNIIPLMRDEPPLFFSSLLGDDDDYTTTPPFYICVCVQVHGADRRPPIVKLCPSPPLCCCSYQIWASLFSSSLSLSRFCPYAQHKKKKKKLRCCAPFHHIITPRRRRVFHVL